MNDDLKKQLEYCNILEWWDRGYTGKGVTIFMDDTDKLNHWEHTSNIVQTILPEARVLKGSINTKVKNGTVYECDVYCDDTKETLPFEEFIRKYNVSLINNSKDGGEHDRDSPKSVYLRQMRDTYNLILTGSAGNPYGQSINNSFYGAAIMVTGCSLQNDTPKWGKYVEDQDIDFTCFTACMPGTSFSAPFLCGMCGLLRSKYPGMTQAEAYEYFKPCSELTDNKSKYGWGLVTMGNPSKKIIIPIDSKTMLVDGKEIALDQPATIDKKSKRTLVPIRAIAEAFGANVEWDNNSRTVIIEL